MFAWMLCDDSLGDKLRDASASLVLMLLPLQALKAP